MCRILFVLFLSIVIGEYTVSADTVNIDITGGTGMSIHGIDVVKDTLFGENMGSGGYGGAEKINAKWFRSTSATTIIKGAVEDKKHPGFPDPAWLAKKYPATGTNSINKSVNRVKLFHVRANKNHVNWPPRPFTGRKGSVTQAMAWAEICSAYVENAMRPYANGDFPETMWEFGNEVMWEHYLKTPAYSMDPNRQGPGCNGANAGAAYRQWVYYASKAIKEKVPRAYIMAGSGDMITYSSGDWWGWKYWDKPFLDMCISNIDAYATHWYSVVPEQMIIEASLIHNYTVAHYDKPIPTHVTEYNIASGISGNSSKLLQWCRTRYDAEMLFAAFRDPDKIAGLYRFIYSDPRFMPRYQVKGSILEKWLMLTKELRGKRLLAKSSSDTVKSVAVESDNSIVVLAYNKTSNSTNVTFNLKAPLHTKVISYNIASLQYDRKTDEFKETVKTNILKMAESVISVPVLLTAGASAILTAELNERADIAQTMKTVEYIPKRVMISANEKIRINVQDDVADKYVMLRCGIEVRSSNWSDLWADINGHLYKLPTRFWRRPCQLISIPILSRHIKRGENDLRIITAGQDDVNIITAAIELSDVAMTARLANPVKYAVTLNMKEQDFFAGQSYDISIKSLANSLSSLNISNISFDLPENWSVTQEIITNQVAKYKLFIPENAVIDWYPLEANINVYNEKINLRRQIRINTPVQCTKFIKAPVIDGDLAEWNSNTAARIIAPCDDPQVLIWTPGHRKYFDTGKSMRLSWDKSGFYFAASFTNDKPVGAWLDMFFDLNADRTVGRWDRNDHQFTVKLGKDGKAILKQILWDNQAPRIEINPQPGAKARWTQKDKQIFVEGFIPAEAFNIFAPVKGDIIGFDFRINDKIQWYSRAYEQAQNQFPSTKAWGREQVLRNPASWGWLVFK